MRQLFENCLHSLFSSRARKAAVALVFLALAALCFSPRADAALTTREERCAYLASLGLTADPESEELREVELPARFDALLENYNRLQLDRGFDLRTAAGERVLCCSYDLVGYPGWDGRVVAVLYLRRGRVIGGDVHTAAVNGFMLPLPPARRFVRMNKKNGGGLTKLTKKALCVDSVFARW